MCLLYVLDLYVIIYISGNFYFHGPAHGSTPTHTFWANGKTEKPRWAISICTKKTGKWSRRARNPTCFTAAPGTHQMFVLFLKHFWSPLLCYTWQGTWFHIQDIPRYFWNWVHFHASFRYLFSRDHGKSPKVPFSTSRWLVAVALFARVKDDGWKGMSRAA